MHLIYNFFNFGALYLTFCYLLQDTYVLCRVTKRNDFTIEGENASVQTEEADDCQNAVNDLYASLQESVIQEESNQFGITENLDEWFEELFDPDFDGSICFNSSLLAKESKNEPQVYPTSRCSTQIYIYIFILQLNEMSKCIQQTETPEKWDFLRS